MFHVRCIVPRIGSVDGTLPCEIFSNLGSGTMVYSSDYGKIRAMRREDISQVLSIIRPFVLDGILLPRTEEQLEASYSDYIVFEIDGAVRACSALHIYDRTQAEIAAVSHGDQVVLQFGTDILGRNHRCQL